MPSTLTQCELIDVSTMLKNYAQAAVAAGLPLAIWRMPNDKNIHLAVDYSGRLHPQKLDLEEASSGFAFQAFEGKEAFLLHNDFYFQSEKGILKQHTKSTDTELRKEGEQRFLAALAKVYHNKNQKTVYFVKPAPVSRSQRAHFERAVRQAVEAISENAFEKVVLSRNKTIMLSENYEWIDSFLAVSNAYPTAFVATVSAADFGTWLCATPEILVSMDKEGIFRTISLAGTQARNGLENLRQAAWSQKEIEEQAMVSRYIINCFKKIRLREFEEKGPRTVAAGNLIHLRTDFSVDTKATNFEALSTVMLELLHPTSAVCGMPKEAALDFIRKTEGYDRSFYSGYLGTVNIEQESHLFVHLRCLQLHEKEATLYAGGGITADSIPEKEWEETEMKCLTLASVFDNAQ
ncbi:MAG: chorismate-binding protein [Bernardetiaceae bacterium]|nr:chorismate-binding protein [Bernardetiaceae bacterium]